MPKETHTKAAEHHENAAKAHRTAAEHHGKGEHDKGHDVRLARRFAVGTAIAGRPPPRSGLAQLRHPAPTLGV